MENKWKKCFFHSFWWWQDWEKLDFFSLLDENPRVFLGFLFICVRITFKKIHFNSVFEGRGKLLPGTAMCQHRLIYESLNYAFFFFHFSNFYFIDFSCEGKLLDEDFPFSFVFLFGGFEPIREFFIWFLVEIVGVSSLQLFDL